MLCLSRLPNQSQSYGERTRAPFPLQLLHATPIWVALWGSIPPGGRYLYSLFPVFFPLWVSIPTGLRSAP